MSADLIEKLRELQGVIARGGITRLPDSETIRQAVEAISAQGQEQGMSLLRELHECGAIANWLRVGDDLKQRIESAIATNPQQANPIPSQGTPAAIQSEGGKA